MRRIEQAAQDSFQKKDAGSFKGVPVSSTSVSSSALQHHRNVTSGAFDQDMGYMKPRKVGGGNGTFTLDDMKNEDQGPIWSAHYDEDAGEIYYFNRKTNDSQWERPKNFDGYEIMTGKNAKRYGDQSSREDYERTFGITFAQATMPLSAND